MRHPEERYLVNSESKGCLLGVYRDVAFWSQENNARMGAAITFDSHDECTAYMGHHLKAEFPQDMEMVPVQTDLGDLASLQCCIDHGITPWTRTNQE